MCVVVLMNRSGWWTASTGGWLQWSNEQVGGWLLLVIHWSVDGVVEAY